MSFESFNLDQRILSIIKSEGYENPTPIQEQAIPSVMQGRDVLGLAQTGTGKTAAFVLPLVHKLAQTKSQHVRALIVAPTRELAQQIFETVRTFGKPLGLHATTVFGGASMYRQVADLRRGVDLVVGCPGRILDHLDSQTMDLSGLEYLVLDEADQMFDMGFAPSIRRLVQQLPKKRQTLLFSATMPKEIRHLATEVMHNPATVQVGQQTPTTTVAQALFPVPGHLKSALLSTMLKHTDTESVLIFVRTKARAKRLHKQLEQQQFNVTSLQGNLSPGRRKEAMQGFRSGEYQIMVATDIAARGIDISSISHVINYDIPDTVEAYTHRIGRTGRAAKTGDAFTLISREDEGMVRDIERRIKTTLERRKVDGFNYEQAATAESSLGGQDRRRPQQNRRARSFRDNSSRFQEERGQRGQRGQARGNRHPSRRRENVSLKSGTFGGNNNSARRSSASSYR